MDYTLSRIFKIVIVLLVVAVMVWFMLKIRSTMTLLIISVLFAYILDPIASYFEYRGLSRIQATIIIFLFIATSFIVIFYFLIPPLIDELSNIQQSINSGTATAFIEKVERLIQNSLPMVGESNIDLKARISDFAANLSSSVFSLLLDMVSVVTTLIIIPFAVFFLLKDGPAMKTAFVSLIPNRYFEMTLNLLYKIDIQLGGFLRGQFFDASIVGLLAIFAMWLLNVKYYIVVGIFAGLTNMIPYVGPFSGAVAAVFVVLMSGGSGHQVLMVIMAFLIIQLSDNVLIQPLVVARSVNLHPLIIIFAVIIGGQFFGILGMLLAVPATGIIKVVAQELYNSYQKYRTV
jgi:predicted PurR-regulated permease PerM